MDAGDVIEVLERVDALGIPHCVDGGWCVEPYPTTTGRIGDRTVPCVAGASA